MTDARAAVTEAALLETLLRLEQRVERLEARLELPPHGQVGDALVGAAELPPPAPTGADQDLEFVVGQNWMASVGILVLTCGVGFALLLPLDGLPPVLPSLAGGVVAGVLAFLAHRWRASFELVAGYFRGAAMALLYFSVLRLALFGAEHVLSVDSLGACLLLSAVAAANVIVAMRLRSAWLLGIALFTGFVTVVACGATVLVLAGITTLLAIGAYAAASQGWQWLLLFVIPAGYLSHLLWLVNRPWSGRTFELATRPGAAAVVLAYVTANALGSLLRKDRSEEDAATVLAVLLNCGIGYALLAVATFGASVAAFTVAHAAAGVVFLGLAVAFWRVERSRVSTFFYAMTGYLALSVALARLVPLPNLFIWLSWESLLVVATALWFRSKLIVLGNFFIFVAIVVTYMVVATSESGISIGFGLVALLTARILRWQHERLELQTELMRDAYLASAFVIFPYSLYHLVPRAFVAVSWVGAALAYYVMNLVVRSPKYRWMGHLTLLLTAGYMIVIGLFQLGPGLRIASFLVLGTALLVVSLVFTMARARRRGPGGEAER